MSAFESLKWVSFGWCRLFEASFTFKNHHNPPYCKKTYRAAQRTHHIAHTLDPKLLPEIENVACVGSAKGCRVR